MPISLGGGFFHKIQQDHSIKPKDTNRSNGLLFKHAEKNPFLQSFNQVDRTTDREGGHAGFFKALGKGNGEINSADIDAYLDTLKHQQEKFNEKEHKLFGKNKGKKLEAKMAGAEALKENFAAMDANKDGTLTKAEVKSFKANQPVDEPDTPIPVEQPDTPTVDPEPKQDKMNGDTNTEAKKSKMDGDANTDAKKEKMES